MDNLGRNVGNYNAVSWSLLENATTKTGVPAALRAAVLLKREDEKHFKCVVKIDAVVDHRSKLERMFGGKGKDPKDDPVIFNPELDPTNKLRQYDVENLGAIDIQSLSDVKWPQAL